MGRVFEKKEKGQRKKAKVVWWAGRQVKNAACGMKGREGTAEGRG